MRILRPKRDGKVIALFALLLPPLLGIVSLTIDVGIILATHRQAQSGADGAALAAARELLANSSGTMSSTALALVRSSSSLSSAEVEVFSPPSAGAFAGNSHYVEVVVTVRVSTYFIQVLNGESNQPISARAVAGIESVAPRDLITCLAPYAVPGLTVDDIALNVDGRVSVNSQGSGLDEIGASVEYGSPASAVRLPNGGTLHSTNLRVVGGVENVSSITAHSAKEPALSARRLPRTDPFLHLLTPTISTGVVNTDLGHVVKVVGAANITLSPGIYNSLEISGSGSGTVTFGPGVYVFRGGNDEGKALWIDTTSKIVAEGVLIYNTGSNYDPTTGLPDQDDGNTLKVESGVKFGSVHIKAGELTFKGLAALGNPLNGLAFYQRRSNTQPMSIKSGATSSLIAGTTYARWSEVWLALEGSWQGHIVAGSVKVSGLTSANAGSISRGAIYLKSPLVFLAE